MENLILVFAVLITANFIWQKLKVFFQRKIPSPTTKNKTLQKSKNDREDAISHLMANLKKAKMNRHEIIEENPKLAAKIIKLWVNKK